MNDLNLKPNESRLGFSNLNSARLNYQGSNHDLGLQTYNSTQSQKRKTRDSITFQNPKRELFEAIKVKGKSSIQASLFKEKPLELKTMSKTNIVNYDQKKSNSQKNDDFNMVVRPVRQEKVSHRI